VEALIGELAAVVAGDDLAGEPLQYADFSEWQHDQLSSTDDGAQAAKAFWERAAEAPAPLLPLAKAAQGAPVLDEVALSIDADLSQAIVDLAARYTSTPHIVIQAAWHAFLRVTAQDDLVITTLNATPPSDLEGAVGSIARRCPPYRLCPPSHVAELIVDRRPRAGRGGIASGRLPSRVSPPPWVPSTSFEAGVDAHGSC
jgi:hypothetical protein